MNNVQQKEASLGTYEALSIQALTALGKPSAVSQPAGSPLIVVEVSGGVVESVYSNVPGLQVMLLEHDNEECGEDPLGALPVQPLADLDPSYLESL